MRHDEEEEPPASPAETMRLIQEGRDRAERGLCLDPRLLSWPWGVAWLVGFGLMFLRHGPDGRVLVSMPEGLPLAVLGGLLAAAAGVNGIGIGRAARGVHGESAQRGWMYGLAFFAGAASVAVTVSRVEDGLTDQAAGLLWSASMVGLVATMHIAGGAVWQDRFLLGLGVWLVVTNIAGVIAGPGWHALLVAVAGGGGMLLLGAVLWRRQLRRAE